jgi:CRP/FNR family transcriptional regulator
MAHSTPPRIPATGPVRTLSSGEILFQTGDTRSRMYRVERGALCHYYRWEDGTHEIIEFAFPGDIVGLGHLDTHVSTAQAIAETTVSFVSEEELERELANDGQLASRAAAAGDREFDFMRLQAVKSGQDKPVERVASFLSALSHISAMEGRDPTLVTDEIPSGFVADHLHMSIEGLAGALRELERRGMVRPTDEGLRIADVTELDRLAKAA